MEPRRPQPLPSPEHRARDRRDASLGRVSRITGGVALGSASLVGALGVYVSRALPGHLATTSVASGAAGATGAPTGDGPSVAPATTTPTGQQVATTTPQSATPATQPQVVTTTPATQPQVTAPPLSPPTTAPVPTRRPAQVRTGAS